MEQRLLAVLQGLLSEHAHSALSRPKGTEPYHHGHAVGVYAGIRMAIEKVEAAIRDELEDDEEE